VARPNPHRRHASEAINLVSLIGNKVPSREFTSKPDTHVLRGRRSTPAPQALSPIEGPPPRASAESQLLPAATPEDFPANQSGAVPASLQGPQAASSADCSADAAPAVASAFPNTPAMTSGDCPTRA